MKGVQYPVSAVERTCFFAFDRSTGWSGNSWYSPMNGANPNPGLLLARAYAISTQSQIVLGVLGLPALGSIIIQVVCPCPDCCENGRHESLHIIDHCPNRQLQSHQFTTKHTIFVSESTDYLETNSDWCYRSKRSCPSILISLWSPQSSGNPQWGHGCCKYILPFSSISVSDDFVGTPMK